MLYALNMNDVFEYLCQTVKTTRIPKHFNKKALQKSDKSNTLKRNKFPINFPQLLNVSFIRFVICILWNDYSQSICGNLK